MHNRIQSPIVLQVLCLYLWLLPGIAPGITEARELTLKEAFDIAVSKSSRGEIISGDLEVAREQYDAEKTNFYIPEISINGTAPVYNQQESFRFFGGLNQKQLIKTTDLNFNANIKLHQNLITGGDFTATSNIWNSISEYPVTLADQRLSAEEVQRQGIFDFSLTQPLLKPSEPKFNLRNRKDELEIARMTSVEETAILKKEVAEAFFGVLQTSLALEITGEKLESARLKADIDSSKFNDGILAEEDWLESASGKLDAELEHFDKENESVEKSRELALLLDLEVTEAIDPKLPEVGEHIGDNQKNYLVNNWEASIPILKARSEYEKAQRQADFTAASHGLTGTLEATYTMGRGEVEVDYGDFTLTDDNNTNSWEVRLNFSLPIWDGGKTGAQIKAARLSAKKSELEYQRIKRSARAEIVNLINRLDVSYRKLEVLKKQIELAEAKLKVARFRFDDGQISRLEYLESSVSYLEVRNKYIDELRLYLLDRIELEGKFVL